MKKRVIFFGTPKIASCLLEALLKVKSIEIIAVFCQPDKEYNRHKNIVFGAVKQLCIDNDLTFFQPNNINDEYALISSLKPELIITCAYGQFISEKILNIPDYHCVNFHASLLPKLRGGAPIHWAIINGFEQTGITLMYMTKKMDAGNIIKQYPIAISNDDTYKTLYDKLCLLVQEIVVNEINFLFNQNLKSTIQNEEDVTFGLNIKKEDTIINFDDYAKNIFNLIRGLNDKPVAKIIFNNQLIKVFESQITNEKSIKVPGTIVDINKNGMKICTKDYDLNITKIQLPSKKIIHIKELINGNFIFKIGDLIKASR